ncbi:hypothetical protein MOBT1_001064 [Malassezia obtusa]|uniref:Uncharacterized protein n=1 Tax=Malassezia obtusa TaxID=76774 RepID=A0AAF0E2J5_9BASI|nr:hypothetical protein MOBT1_001064 [Malassezia obtusa]
MPGAIQEYVILLDTEMQSSSTIELDAMEVDDPKKTNAPASTGSRNPAPGPVLRPADDEILLDDEESEESFDDATIDDTETIASSVGPTPNLSTRAPPPGAAPAPAMSSMNHSSSSLVSPRNPPNQRGGSNIFSKFIKRSASREEPAAPTMDGLRDESGRLRRYSANTDEPAEGQYTPPASSLGGATGAGASRVPPPRGPGAPSGAAGAPTGATRLGSGPAGGASTGGSRLGSSAPAPRGKNPRTPPSAPPKPGVKQFRVVGATPRSVQALIFYLYTSQVHFVSSPHQSPHSDATSLHEEASELLGDGSKQNPSLWPPAFSSKAAYCLGQQLDLRDLSLRAFDHLTLNLSTRTVLADLLSPFGDRFPEVQRAHLDFITLHWEEVKTRPDFAPTIENLVHGQYPNSSKSLFQLFSKLSIRSF